MFKKVLDFIGTRIKPVTDEGVEIIEVKEDKPDPTPYIVIGASLLLAIGGVYIITKK